MKHIFAISAYKESPYLEDTIISLKHQSVPTDIIICTSTANDHILGLGEKYHIPVYVREGASSLRDDWNYAVRIAHGKLGADLVTIAHQDDIYHRDYAKALRRAISRYNDMSVFCTRYRVIDKDGNLYTQKNEKVKRGLRFLLRLRKLADKSFIKRSALIFGNAICCPSITYNMNLITEPVFRDDYKFVIDWVALLRLADEKGRFVCMEKELVDYRVHADAETKKQMDNSTRENEEREIFESLWGKLAAKLIMLPFKSAYKEYDNK